MQTFRICGKQKSSGGSGKHGEHVTSPRRVGYFLISYHSYKHKQVSFSDTCVSLTRQIVVHCWRCWGRGRLRSNTLILPPPQKNASHLQLNLQKQYHPWQAHHDQVHLVHASQHKSHNMYFHTWELTLQPGELLPMTCRLAAIDMKVDETAKLEWKQPLLDVQWFAGVSMCSPFWMGLIQMVFDFHFVQPSCVHLSEK